VPDNGPRPFFWREVRGAGSIGFGLSLAGLDAATVEPAVE